MPIYEFRCESGHIFGVERPITDFPTSAVCPTCERPTTKRIYSVHIGRNDVSKARSRAPQGSDADTPNVTMIDCAAIGCGTGIRIGEGAYVKSKGLRLKDNRIGIDNAGRFDGPDTRFE